MRSCLIGGDLDLTGTRRVSSLAGFAEVFSDVGGEVSRVCDGVRV